MKRSLSVVNLRSCKSSFAPTFLFFGTVPVKQHEHFYGHLLRHCVEGVVGNSNKFHYFAKYSITIRSTTAQQQNFAWNFEFRTLICC